MATISDILISQGQLAAQARRTRGGQWAPLVQHLANLPNQIAADRQAARDAQEAAVDRQQQRDVRQQQLTKGDQELATAEATAEAKRQMRDLMSSDGVIGPDGSISIQRGQEIARSKGYSDILPDFLTIAQGNNATIEKGGRERILFDQQQTDRRQTTNQQGVRRMIGESVAARGGEPITPGERQTYQGMAFQEGVTLPAGLVPDDKPFTYGPLDNLMVNGRRTPVRTRSDGAVVDIRGNVIPDAQPDVPPRAAPQDQYMWGKDKTGTVRLMTPQEIRAEGAQQPDTAEMRNKQAAKGPAALAVKAVRDLGASIITKVGPAQRADAIRRGAEAVWGTDPEFRTYQDSRMALAGTLAVEQQGTRVSDADVKALWLPMVPDAYRDTVESNKLKWELIDAMRGVPTPTALPPPGGANRIYYDSNGNPVSR